MVNIQKNNVVQFNENHKWCGCIGYVKEIKDERIMVGVRIPNRGVAYIYCCFEDLEYIGEAVLVEGEENE